MTLTQKIANFCQKLVNMLTFRHDSRPFDSLAILLEFGSTRSAFVAQKTLYGYLKTRMGIRYPSMFENQDMLDSINIAKIHIFVACLMDFSIFLVGYGLKTRPEDAVLRKNIALRIFETGLKDNEEQVAGIDNFSVEKTTQAFHDRLNDVDWVDVGTGNQYFTESPKALIKWAPIAPELKKYDGEIVRNSILLNWHTIRQQYAKRLKVDELYADVTNEKNISLILGTKHIMI